MLPLQEPAFVLDLLHHLCSPISIYPPATAQDLSLLATRLLVSTTLSAGCATAHKARGLTVATVLNRPYTHNARVDSRRDAVIHLPANQASRTPLWRMISGVSCLCLLTLSSSESQLNKLQRSPADYFRPDYSVCQGQ